MAQISLYGMRRSSATLRVKNVMVHKGLLWQDYEIDLLKRQNESAEYQKINPAMRVPFLIIDHNG